METGVEFCRIVAGGSKIKRKFVRLDFPTHVGVNCADAARDRWLA